MASLVLPQKMGAASSLRPVPPVVPVVPMVLPSCWLSWVAHWVAALGGAGLGRAGQGRAGQQQQQQQQRQQETMMRQTVGQPWKQVGGLLVPPAEAGCPPIVDWTGQLQGLC
jgi:hypothetical protein